MEAPNRKEFGNLIDRYQSLRLRGSLSKSSQYVLACKELSLILKNGYSKFPKNLQSLVFQDTLFAFSILPEMLAQSAIPAAYSLLQSAEFALPKQKRALAVKEHKHAVVASKRKSKTILEEEGLTLLPHDVLVHILISLDVQSLVSASSVCRSWNVAAHDNHLWKSLYNTCFCNHKIIAKLGGRESREVTKNKDNIHSPHNIGTGVGIDWRCAYITAYKETYHRRRFKSNRGYCSSCHSIIWLCSSECFNKLNHRIKPVSTQQIMEYVLDGLLLSESSSDSDSDDNDASVLKLWAYPRQIN